MAEETSPRELGIRSRPAVHAGDRDGRLDFFADDALVQDPIGPSPFDPEAEGHRGKVAIAAFYDSVIAPSEAISFEIEHWEFDALELVELPPRQ